MMKRIIQSQENKFRNAPEILKIEILSSSASRAILPVYNLKRTEWSIITCAIIQLNSNAETLPYICTYIVDRRKVNSELLYASHEHTINALHIYECSLDTSEYTKGTSYGERAATPQIYHARSTHKSPPKISSTIFLYYFTCHI